MRTTAVDQRRELVRQCVSDLGWTLEALAVAMGKSEDYRAYISRVLNGEKPLGLEFFDALPEDVKAEYHSREATERGRIVVMPSRGDDAVRHFVAGLLGVFDALKASTLPAKAGPPLKAELTQSRERKVS
ncbi:MAG: hypothetical protein GEV06_19685 [Luteitalea sp.]|nr:hypothetical protein [Luteitalea sp.]